MKPTDAILAAWLAAFLYTGWWGFGVVLVLMLVCIPPSLDPAVRLKERLWKRR